MNRAHIQLRAPKIVESFLETQGRVPTRSLGSSPLSYGPEYLGHHKRDQKFAQPPIQAQMLMLPDIKEVPDMAFLSASCKTVNCSKLGSGCSAPVHFCPQK